MTVLRFFLLCTILVFSNGQTFNRGKCNRNVETIDYFQKDLILGNWFLTQRAYNSLEEGTRCHTVTIKPHQDGGFLIEESYIESDIYHLTPRLTDIFNSYDAGNGNGRKGIRYVLYASEQELLSGKTHLIPGLVSGRLPVWFISTDYENFALSYSCEDVPGGKVEYSWLLTRNPHPDYSYVPNPEMLLRSQNINLLFRNVEQTCRY